MTDSDKDFRDKCDRILVMTIGGASIGGAIGQIPGSIVGGAVAAIYGWYVGFGKKSGEIVESQKLAEYFGVGVR